jgi:DNA-directed RNA polymerase specialized sigma24 family protein
MRALCSQRRGPGDRTAFGRLIERHRDGLELYCYLMLGDSVAADRAMAETVLSAWLEPRDLEYLATVPTWLYRVASACALPRLARPRARLDQLRSPCNDEVALIPPVPCDG